MKRRISKEHFTDVWGRRQHHAAVVMETASGLLVSCLGGAWRWKGPYPGRTWDQYFDEDLAKFQTIQPHWYQIPALTLGPARDWCRTRITHNGQTLAESCRKVRWDYKHCSMSCWFLAQLQSISHLISDLQILQEDEPTQERAREVAELTQEYSRFRFAFESAVVADQKGNQ